MTHRIKRSLFGLILTSLVVLPASGTVIVKVHGPDHVPDLERKLGYPEPQIYPLGMTSQTKGAAPSDQWFVPFYRVDTQGFSDTTLWSARNETGFVAPLNVSYFTRMNLSQTGSQHLLNDKQILTANVRDIAGLATDQFGFAEGFVSFFVTNPFSIDTFQIDVSRDLATGQKAVQITEFCTKWQVRFIKFTPTDGSIFQFLLNGPQGVGQGDPPTITGTIYDESGAPVTTFDLQTDETTFTIESLTITPSDLAAGAIEFTFNTRFSPAGYVSVGHRADGRFSAGLDAFCLQP